VLYSQCKRYRDDWPAHDGPVTALAVSPDGKTVATAGHDGKVRLWTPDGKPLATMHEHAARVNVLAFSPDSLTLASGGNDGLIKLWDVREGRGRSTLRVAGQVSGLAFHPSGRQLFSCSGPEHGWGTLQSWDLRTLASRRVYSTQMQPLSGVAVSPDGSLVACGDQDNNVGVYVTATGSRWVSLRLEKDAAPTPVTVLTFFDGGKQLVGGSPDGTVRVWDTEVRRPPPTRSFNTGLGAVTALAAHPRGECVALAVMRNDDPEGGPDLRLWHLRAGRLDDPVRSHDGGVGGLAFSPDGRSLFTAGRDRGVKVWDYPGRRESVLMRNAVARPGTVAFSRDGHTLAWVRRDPPQGPGSMVAVYDLQRGELAAAVPGHDRTIRCMALSSDGKTVAFSSGPDDLPAELLLWDVRRKPPARVGVLTGHKAAVTALAAGPEAHDLVSAGLDGMVKVWRADRERRSFSEPGASWLAVAYADGGAIAAGGALGEGGVVCVWDAEGEPVRRIETKRPVRCVALSPDGESVAWSEGGGEVRLVGEREAALETGMTEVAWVAFSTDGKTLAVGGAGTAVQLWDVADAQMRATLAGHRGGACYVGFASDGKTLFSGGAAGQGRLWYRGEARAR
jgi:WD40 repeat protein